MQEEYGVLCLYDDLGMLYLAPHGPDSYKLIEKPVGAAIFEKSVAQEIINDSRELYDSGELFFVPLNVNNVNPNVKQTTITSFDQWKELNK